jgi:hypothetical protein
LAIFPFKYSFVAIHFCSGNIPFRIELVRIGAEQTGVFVQGVHIRFHPGASLNAQLLPIACVQCAIASADAIHHRVVSAEIIAEINFNMKNM